MIGPLGKIVIVGTSVVAISSVARAQGGPMMVETAPVRLAPVAKTIELVGTVRPVRRAIVAAQVPGYVEVLPIEIGQSVREGETLCQLRDDTRRMALDETNARLKQLEAVVAESEAMREKWAFEKQRLEGLWATRKCSEKELKDGIAEFAAAEARVQGARSAWVSQEALARRAADDLAHCTITAPFDGVVVEKRTEIGQWVNEGGEVAALVALNVARARIHVPEQAISYAVVGEPVAIRLDALGSTLEGLIGRVSPDGDERARTFPVEIDVPNPDGRIMAGMFVRAAFPSGPRERRLLVSKDAVVRREGAGPMIFVVGPGPPSDAGAPAMMGMPLPVRIEAELADAYAVTADGLKEGDAVVVRGNERMFGPTPVMVLSAPTSAPAVGSAEARR
jgi:membrane fusion protein (multidrug efflux system)